MLKNGITQLKEHKNYGITMIPNGRQLMTSVVKALFNLGGSGNINEIYEEVVKLENFDEETLSIMGKSEKSRQTEVRYRLGWARTHLKEAGYLENSAKGVWSLTNKAIQEKQINASEVVSYIRCLNQKPITENKKSVILKTEIDEIGNTTEDLELKKQHQNLETENDNTTEEDLGWRNQLHAVLTEEMRPGAFERLTQRILRESGFYQVKVTGRTGDGGIDGIGIARINGLISFHIAFQCKKYKGSVASSKIRDFRGAIDGRVDRGIFITTGRFTKAAIEEANRDGCKPIDLIDREQLADKLKELSLEIKIEQDENKTEKITIDSQWFLDL